MSLKSTLNTLFSQIFYLNDTYWPLKFSHPFRSLRSQKECSLTAHLQVFFCPPSSELSAPKIDLKIVTLSVPSNLSYLNIMQFIIGKHQANSVQLCWLT